MGLVPSLFFRTISFETINFIVFKHQVSELTEFSKQWNREAPVENGNLDAFRLLSQKNFDAKKLFEDVNSINFKVPISRLHYCNFSSNHNHMGPAWLLGNRRLSNAPGRHRYRGIFGTSTRHDYSRRNRRDETGSRGPHSRNAAQVILSYSYEC